MADNKLRTFYILIITQIFSMLGSRMSAFAVALRVSIDTGQATPVALVALFTVLPEILFGNIAGLVVDRYDRRQVLALADFGQAIGSFILFVSFLTNNFELWHLYVVTLIQGIFLAFQMPASEATTTLLIPDEHRNRANALKQMSGSLAGVFAPAIAGLLLVPVGVPGIIIIDLVTFLIAVSIISTLKIPNPPRSKEAEEAKLSVFKEASAGFQFLLSRRMLLYMIVYAAVLNFVLDATTTILLPYVYARTGNEGITGLVTGALDLGIIMGGIVIGIWGGTRPRIHTLVLSTVALFAALAIFGTLRHPLLLGVGAFAIAFPLPIGNAPFFSMLQAKVPPDLQGRVFAVVMQISSVLRPAGLLLIGPLADKVLEPMVGGEGWKVVAPLVGDEHGAGMGLIMLVAGSFLAVLTLIFYSLPRVRHMEETLPDYHVEVAPEITLTSRTSDTLRLLLQQYEKEKGQQ